MKIISGKYKGRKIEGFEIEGTRPTMDRIRESLFAMIQNHIGDAIVLDLFAGTGSLGLEALSNGAKECYFIDNKKNPIETIQRAISKIGVEEKVVIQKMDFQKALSYFKQNNISFDLIFLDPPYAMHVLDEIISSIKENKLLKKEGLIICEYENIILKSTCYPLYKEKKYGNKKITIYKNDE